MLDLQRFKSSQQKPAAVSEVGELVFTATATQTPAVTLTLAPLTPTTPDCTRMSFSRVRIISKSKKSKSSRLQTQQPFRQTRLGVKNRENKKIRKKTSIIVV
jgi:hypothetical protein